MGDDRIQALISAQNRTTHAVRAIARFVVITAMYGFTGGLIIGLGYSLATEISWLVASQLIGAVLILIGFIHGLWVASDELELSDARVEEGHQLLQLANDTRLTGDELYEFWLSHEGLADTPANAKRYMRLKRYAGLL